jgi:hypothetical protein
MTADFVIVDFGLRLSIVDLLLNQQSSISVVNPQSKNPQSPFRHLQ